MNKEKVERNVARALAEVPIDNKHEKHERDTIRARLRRKYADLQSLKLGMKPRDRRRFEELGELMEKLEACENSPPETRKPTS